MGRELNVRAGSDVDDSAGIRAADVGEFAARIWPALGRMGSEDGFEICHRGSQQHDGGIDRRLVG